MQIYIVCALSGDKARCSFAAGRNARLQLLHKFTAWIFCVRTVDIFILIFTHTKTIRDMNKQDHLFIMDVPHSPVGKKSPLRLC